MTFLGQVWDNVGEQKRKVTAPCLNMHLWFIYRDSNMVIDITILKGTLRHYLAGLDRKERHDITFTVESISVFLSSSFIRSLICRDLRNCLKHRIMVYSLTFS